jgi:hypothetical protein
MATTHAPGAGFGPGDAHKHRRAAVIAVAVLACAAIGVPAGVRGLDDDDARASAATPTTPAGSVPHHRLGGGIGDEHVLGPQGDLPPLLASSAVGVRAGLRAGARVRVGDITSGSLRRTPAGWQVVVRWAGRLQPLTLRGPVSLTHASWLSADGLLYTRVPTARPGHFTVYAWDPHGGSAYTPPSLVAVSVGQVCFNRSFTAFGNCRVAG